MIEILELVAVGAFTAFITWRLQVQSTAENEARPTLAEAQAYVQETYPEYADRFVVTEKSICTVTPQFCGAPIHIYASYLECEELGVCIRLRS